VSVALACRIIRSESAIIELPSCELGLNALSISRYRPATIRTSPNRIYSLNYGLKKRGCGWISVDASRLKFDKNLNFYNHLQHSLDFSRSPQKVEVERETDYLFSRHNLD